MVGSVWPGSPRSPLPQQPVAGRGSACVGIRAFVDIGLDRANVAAVQALRQNVTGTNCCALPNLLIQFGEDKWRVRAHRDQRIGRTLSFLLPGDMPAS